ncbi:MAG: T9SS type A sorting domain-containing protein [Saprospiraceae bacterium]|nr:T9SS type A sorting domain-containing protein [Saprospiraceae bacterium]
MNHLKLLQFLFIFSTYSILNGQCPTVTPGYLSGTTSGILLNDTTPAPVLNISPPFLPNTEFIFIHKDSLATDSLGYKIIGTNADGRMVPADYGLTTCSNFSVVAVSFDINQLKVLVDNLFNLNYDANQTCCQFIGSFLSGFCDSIIANGINSSADINNLDDFFTLMSIFADINLDQSSFSIENIILTITQMNDLLPLFGNCSNNVQELCYAIMNTDAAMDHYIVTEPNTPYSVNIAQDTLIIALGDTANLTATFLPNTAIDSLAWHNTDSLSNIHVNTITGEITNTGNTADTAWIVVESLIGCGPTDTIVVILAPTISIKLLNIKKLPFEVIPNPFNNWMKINFNASEGNYLLQLIGITGQLYYSQNQYLSEGNQQIEVDTENIPEGYYFLRIKGSKTKGTQAVFKN